MPMQCKFAPLWLLLVSYSWCAAADDLLTPPKDAPTYQLSNFRTEKDSLGKTIWAIDFQRTHEGSGTLFLKGKSSQGPLTIGAPVSASTASGTIRLQSFFPDRGERQLDMELYLVQSHYWGEGFSRDAMVSNAVRLGNPGEPTKARDWTDEEKAAFEKYLRNKDDDNAEKPRKSYPVSIDVPSDSQVVPADLKLKPGTPLQACYGGKWNPIRTLSENEDGSLNVSWVDYGRTYDCSMIRDELIIKTEIATLLRTNPSSLDFSKVDAKPRKRYAVSIAVPAHSQLVPMDAKLKPGTPLQACYAGKWNPITTLSENTDGSLNVRWDDYGPAFDCSMVREELIIKKVTLRQLTSSSPKTTASQTADVRTWTDATGQFKVKAKLVKKTSTEVTLLTEAGREVTLPFSKLSQADLDFLGSSTKAENPFGGEDR